MAMEHKELDFEKECRRMARRAGWIAVKIEKNGHKGIPDDLFISPDGKCVLVELKKDNKQRPRPEQTAWMERFPMLCYLVGDTDTFKQVLGLQ